jgi:hypothetical protein
MQQTWNINNVIVNAYTHIRVSFPDNGYCYKRIEALYIIDKIV